MSKKLRELQAKKADAVKAARGITDIAAAAGRDLSDDENKQFEAFSAQIGAANAAIDRETLLASEERALGVEVPDGAIIKVQDNRENDPKHGFKSLGDFAKSVVAASRSGNGPEQRLLIGAAAPSTVANEGAGADGGFMIPPEYSKELFRLTLGEDSLIPYTQNTETESNSMVFPKTEQTPWGTNGVRAYWQAEATAGSPTKPILSTQTLRMHKLLALIPLTDELVADQSALSTELPGLISDSIRWKTNEAILFGNGNGQPLGALNSGAIITVAKDAGQATGTLSALNLANMMSRLPPGSFPKAVWVINPSALPSLFTLTLGNYPIYLPGGAPQIGGIQMNPYGTLLGRPIMISQHAASFSSQGDVQLHDLSYYRTLTKAGGIQTATSLHLYFDADAAALRVTFRVDGGSKIAAPISPAKGAITLSPFIQLAAR